MNTCRTMLTFFIIAILLQDVFCACPEGCSCKGNREGIAVSCEGLRTFPKKFPMCAYRITFCRLQIDELPSNAFSHLPRLSSVEIFTSRIKIVRPFAISGLKNLKKLGIYFSEVSVIEGMALSKLKNISHLEVHNSSIGQINSQGFSEISDVMEISFNKASIGVIRAQAFSRVRRIAMFSVRNSKLGTMETEAFHESSFAFFYMHDNRFDKIMCGTVDIAIQEAMNHVSIHGNKMCCGCNTLWMLQPGTRSALAKFLDGVYCVNGKEKNSEIILSSLTWENLPCTDPQERRLYNTTSCMKMPEVSVAESLLSGTSPTSVPATFVILYLALLVSGSLVVA